MPPAEVHIDEDVVRRLLLEQHPDLARLPLERVAEGWDNVVFRVGDELAVRMPRRAAGAQLVAHEQQWLPQLAPHLPLAVPAPVRTGRPGCDYPWSWSVCPWIPGAPAALTPPADPELAAHTLGAFVAALHRPAPPDAPHNPFRGVPLRDRSERLVADLDRLGDTVDGAAIRDLWEAVVEAPPWPRGPVWVHGDLHSGNVLVARGRVSGVIDFGDMAAGDPAVDLVLGWMLFEPGPRALFREAACVDEDTWRRGAGWAVALGVAYLAGGADDRMVSGIGRRCLDAVLRDG